jgi:hypothetical protein
MRRCSVWLLASVFGCLSAGCSLNPRGELPSAGEDSNDGVFQGEPGSAAMSPDEGTVTETPKASEPPPSAPSDGSDILVDDGEEAVPTSDSTPAPGQDTPVVQSGPEAMPDAGDAGVPDGGAGGDGGAPEDAGASDRDGLGPDGGATDAGDAGP